MRWQLITSMLVGLGIFLSTPALADDFAFRWMEALIHRADPTFRELSLLDYRSGLSTSGLQIPGSVDLREFKVGDHVLARVGVNNHLVLHIRKVPPPTGDKRYTEALRRLQTERGEPFDSGNIDLEGTFRHAFEAPGTYRYFCIPHEGAAMAGEVVVKPAPDSRHAPSVCGGAYLHFGLGVPLQDTSALHQERNRGFIRFSC